jgi:hypothetical protein
MVATRLSEVASKGYEWAWGSTCTAAPASTESSTPLIRKNSIEVTPTYDYTSPSALWHAASNSLFRASHSLSSAADQAYSTFAGVANYAWESDDDDNAVSNSGSSANHSKHGFLAKGTEDAVHNPWLQPVVFAGNNFSFGSPWKLNNPYNQVRGRYHYNRSYLSAVRSLLPLVAENNGNTCGNRNDASDHPSLADISESGGDLLAGHSEHSRRPSADDPVGPGACSDSLPYYITNSSASATPLVSSLVHQNSETASQLAEGTVRALRDIALDEAVEFHAALRFWSERWEHPLLSWLEAGPTVWCSREGYDHQLIGKKVATIQAVLARRCTAIGELQQHLLRAGWQRGVAQWGVLGHGGQWATVQGTAVMTEETAAAVKSQRQLFTRLEEQRHVLLNNNNNNNIVDTEPSNLSESLESLPAAQQPPPVERIGLRQEHRGAPRSNNNTKAKRSDRKKWKREKGYYASVFVRNEDDGKILMDDASLAEWSVDAMALIRTLLVRASNGKAKLPYEHHWVKHHPARSIEPQGSEQGQMILDGQQPQEAQRDDYNIPNQSGVLDISSNRQLPIWAQWASKGTEAHKEGALEDDNVVISNLPLMAAEVSELLNSIEDIMPLRRSLRIRKLRPPSMFRRRWYLTVVAAPALTYLAHHLLKYGYGSKLVKATLSKIYKFFQERVYVPFVAIIDEVWKGREDISDKKARLEVIAGLKEMIRSWLDDNHPEIPVAKRLEMAELMDISLIERKKAESMKTIYEINQAVRLSFIEMQFIKKVRRCIGCRGVLRLPVAHLLVSQTYT